MSSVVVLVLCYSGLILLFSLAGGWLPQIVRLTHTRTQLLMSFVAGMMLGVGFFHMLPHSYYEIHSLERAVWWLMIGLLSMFFLQRLFHFHQHGPPEVEFPEQAAHRHDHHHDHDDDHHASGGMGYRLNWMGVAAGLTLHTLMDGIALAAAVKVEALAQPQTAGGLFGLQFYGLGTFLAVLLHKPLDSMAITTLMAAGGWSARAQHLVNGLFALVVPLGAGLFFLGIKQVQADQHVIVGCALAFSAGTFICIALSDLLPEVQFHRHDPLKLSLALLLGIAASYAIGYFETSGHDHTHDHHQHEPSPP